ncbi:unnamed protein product, partial [Cuscuta epithymum]
MDQNESNAVHSYVLQNCLEIDSFRELFTNATGLTTSDELQFQAQFPLWFYHYVRNDTIDHPQWKWVPQKTKDLYWDQFQDLVNWDISKFNGEDIRKGYENYLKQRAYSNIMSKIRERR